MRKPVFNETLQLAIVVRDPDATMVRFVDECGLARGWFTSSTPARQRISVSRSSAPGASLSPRSARCSGLQRLGAMTRVARPTSVFRTTYEN